MARLENLIHRVHGDAHRTGPLPADPKNPLNQRAPALDDRAFSLQDLGDRALNVGGHLDRNRWLPDEYVAGYIRDRFHRAGDIAGDLGLEFAEDALGFGDDLALLHRIA